MIRVLRRRLVAVTVILLTLVLSVALCLLMSSVYRVMEADSLDALQHAGMRYGLHAEHSEGDNGPPKPPDREEGPPKRPGDNQASPIPCFEVGYDHQGQLYADGPGYYDLTDLDYLEALLQQTAETQQDHGILLTEQMRFLKLDDICGEAYQNAVLHITQPGNYTIEGNWHGQIWVDLENYCEDPFTDPTAKVNLILNGVTIDCTVAAGLVFNNVYECDNTWEDQSSWSYKVDTSAAGAVVTLADGTYAYSKLASYSAVTYATNQLKNSTDTALKQLAAAMLNYFFTPNYAPDSGITLYYWNAEDYNAASVLTTANASGFLTLEGSGTGEHRGDITGISAKALSEAVYVAAVYTNGGTTWTSGVLGYSIGSYCVSQASKGGDIANLAMATAVYGYHAKQYFG